MKLFMRQTQKVVNLFDVILLIAILASILFVMLESVQSIDEKYGHFLDVAEWVITILFSLEYVLRIVTVKKPWKYIFSFYGIIDLLVNHSKICFFNINRQSQSRSLKSPTIVANI